MSSDHVEPKRKKGGEAEAVRSQSPAMAGYEVEGGDVADPAAAREPGFNPSRHHHETASRIAMSLVWILAGTVVLHVGGIIWASVANLPSLSSSLTEILKVWLPVLSGLVGSAVAFYFSRDF